MGWNFDGICLVFVFIRKLQLVAHELRVAHKGLSCGPCAPCLAAASPFALVAIVGRASRFPLPVLAALASPPPGWGNAVCWWWIWSHRPRNWGHTVQLWKGEHHCSGGRMWCSSCKSVQVQQEGIFVAIWYREVWQCPKWPMPHLVQPAWHATPLGAALTGFKSCTALAQKKDANLTWPYEISHFFYNNNWNFSLLGGLKHSLFLFQLGLLIDQSYSHDQWFFRWHIFS